MANGNLLGQSGRPTDLTTTNEKIDAVKAAVEAPLPVGSNNIGVVRFDPTIEQSVYNVDLSLQGISYEMLYKNPYVLGFSKSVDAGIEAEHSQKGKVVTKINTIANDSSENIVVKIYNTNTDFSSFTLGTNECLNDIDVYATKIVVANPSSNAGTINYRAVLTYKEE